MGYEKDCEVTGEAEFSYKIKCQVKKFLQTIKDTNEKGHDFQMQEDSFILIPQLEYDEATAFMDDYLNQLTFKKEIEMVCIMKYPIGKPCRMAFCKPNRNHNDYHFFVMSTEHDDALRNIDGKTILIDVRPDGEEEKYDV